MPKTQEWLSEWFSRRAPHVRLRSTDNYFDANAIDSLGVIELIDDMEQIFDVHFSQEDFMDRRFTSLQGLAAILDEKLSQ